jgi:hypothetical protein
VTIFLPGALDTHDETKRVGLFELFKVKLYWKRYYLLNMVIAFGVRDTANSHRKNISRKDKLVLIFHLSECRAINCGKRSRGRMAEWFEGSGRGQPSRARASSRRIGEKYCQRQRSLQKKGAFGPIMIGQSAFCREQPCVQFRSLLHFPFLFSKFSRVLKKLTAEPVAEMLSNSIHKCEFHIVCGNQKYNSGTYSRPSDQWIEILCPRPMGGFHSPQIVPNFFVGCQHGDTCKVLWLVLRLYGLQIDE